MSTATEKFVAFVLAFLG